MGEQALTYLLPALAESPYGLLVIAVIVGIYLAPQLLKNGEDSDNGSEDIVDKKQNLEQMKNASRDELYLTREAEGLYFNEVLKLRSEILSLKIECDNLIIENNRLRAILEENGYDHEEELHSER